MLTATKGLFYDSNLFEGPGQKRYHIEERDQHIQHVGIYEDMREGHIIITCSPIPRVCLRVRVCLFILKGSYTWVVMERNTYTCNLCGRYTSHEPVAFNEMNEYYYSCSNSHLLLTGD